MTVIHDRNRQDADKLVTKAFPAANANNDSASIDLEALVGGRFENVQVEVSVPATTALVADKDLTITIEDSADDSTFAAIPEIAPFVVTGEYGNGSAAAAFRVRLPPTARRYIRINQAVENSGGTITAQSGTLALIF